METQSLDAAGVAATARAEALQTVDGRVRRTSGGRVANSIPAFVDSAVNHDQTDLIMDRRKAVSPHPT